MFGVKRFHAYLFVHPFTLIKDYKALLALFSHQRGIPPQASAWNQRRALTVAHGNADAMSRLPLPESQQVTPLPPVVILLMIE